MITKDLLTSVGVRNDKADIYAPILANYASKYSLTTKQSTAAFLAQVLHESGLFVYTKEIWGKTPTSWQLRYERDFSQPFHNKLTPKDRNYTAFNLGNDEEGDGKKFLGRGLIQLTGKNNYLRCSLVVFRNQALLAQPELLEQPPFAVASAFWFCFDYCKMMPLFESVGIEDETKRINGKAMLGLKERNALFTKLLNNI